jgi:uncharacterized protein (DUF1015 family)
MAQIKAFKAVRPTRDKVHLVATRPVYTYKKSILKAKLEENPYTFIRIINPEYNETKKTKANSRERFLNVKHKFEEFFQAGILIQDKEEHLYLYQQTKDNQLFTGIICGASIEEYQNDFIKKHEATITSREEMFTEYLDIVGFNAEPVLLSYPKNKKLQQIYSEIMLDRPEYEFSTTDCIKHELWILNKNQEELVKNEFSKIEKTYIADGHHRSASSARLAKQINNFDLKTNNHNYFLAFFMDESKLKILEFNRIVKSISGIVKADFLSKLEKNFVIEKLNQAEKPKQEHQISMNLLNNWYLLTCKDEIIDKNHPVACLDPEILTNFILSPLLGITDLKTEKNIEFVSGNLGLDAISDIIFSGKADLGFVLFPLNMKQVVKVADNNLIMPPKSTWVEPKLRSGLTIYNIRE